MAEEKINRRGMIRMTAAGAAAVAGLRWAQKASASGPEGESPHSWAMVIDQEKCHRCGLCQRSCPAGAIGTHSLSRRHQPIPRLSGSGDREGESRSLTVGGDGPFVIDHAACTRCFCCHELCPHGAVVLRRSLVLRLYDAFARWRGRAANSPLR